MLQVYWPDISFETVGLQKFYAGVKLPTTETSGVRGLFCVPGYSRQWQAASRSFWWKVASGIHRDSWQTYRSNGGYSQSQKEAFHVETSTYINGREHLVKFSLMITSRKRSLGQSNVFTHVCHSVHREGVPVWRHFLSGCLVPCSFWGGGLYPWSTVPFGESV